MTGAAATGTFTRGFLDFEVALARLKATDLAVEEDLELRFEDFFPIFKHLIEGRVQVRMLDSEEASECCIGSSILSYKADIGLPATGQPHNSKANR